MKVDLGEEVLGNYLYKYLPIYNNIFFNGFSVSERRDTNISGQESDAKVQ